MCENTIDMGNQSLFEEAKRRLLSMRGNQLRRTGKSPQMTKEAAIGHIQECKKLDAFRASSMSRGFKKVVR
jgi:hypothetical protein